MKFSNRWFSCVISALVLFAVTVAGLNNANATITNLSGGDSTDGWQAPSTYLLAYNPGLAAANQTVQGVTFLGWTSPAAAAPAPPANITVTATATGPFGPYSVPTWSGGTNNDDTDLANVMKYGFYRDQSLANPVTFTISGAGLTAGTYRIDEFYQENTGVSRTLEFRINGTLVDTLNSTSAVSRLISNNFTITTGQSITLTVTSTTTGQASSLNGFVISAVPTPEPSAGLLLMLGGSLTFARWRRRSTR